MIPVLQSAYLPWAQEAIDDAMFDPIEMTIWMVNEQFPDWDFAYTRQRPVYAMDVVEMRGYLVPRLD